MPQVPARNHLAAGRVTHPLLGGQSEPAPFWPFSLHLWSILPGFQSGCPCPHGQYLVFGMMEVTPGVLLW